MITPISANQAIFLSRGTPDMSAKYLKFNTLIESFAMEGHRKVNLPFDDFGFSEEDVEWITDLGYSLFRNGPCLWWEVSW